jgi:hypothetical protein
VLCGSDLPVEAGNTEQVTCLLGSGETFSLTHTCNTEKACPSYHMVPSPDSVTSRGKSTHSTHRNHSHKTWIRTRLKAAPSTTLAEQSPPTTSTFAACNQSGPEQISLPRGESTIATGTTSPRPCLRRLYGHRRRRPEILPRGETRVRAGNDPSRCPRDQWVCIKSPTRGGMPGAVLEEIRC